MSQVSSGGHTVPIKFPAGSLAFHSIPKLGGGAYPALTQAFVSVSLQPIRVHFMTQHSTLGSHQAKGLTPQSVHPLWDLLKELGCFGLLGRAYYQGQTEVSVPGITGSDPQMSACVDQNLTDFAVAFRSHGSGSALDPTKAEIRT